MMSSWRALRVKELERQKAEEKERNKETVLEQITEQLVDSDDVTEEDSTVIKTKKKTDAEKLKSKKV